MLVLDENLPEEEKLRIKKFVNSVKQIGDDLEISGIKDNEIIKLLHQLKKPTFVTLDSDFFKPDLRHKNYCLIFITVRFFETAKYLRPFLKLEQFNTIAKRIGKVIQISADKIIYWELNSVEMKKISW